MSDWLNVLRISEFNSTNFFPALHYGGCMCLLNSQTYSIHVCATSPSRASTNAIIANPRRFTLLVFCKCVFSVVCYSMIFFSAWVSDQIHFMLNNKHTMTHIPSKESKPVARAIKNNNENSTWEEKNVSHSSGAPLKAMHKRNGFRCWTGLISALPSFSSSISCRGGRTTNASVLCVMFKTLKNHKMAFSYENNIEFMSLLLSSLCVRR